MRMVVSVFLTLLAPESSTFTTDPGVGQSTRNTLPDLNNYIHYIVHTTFLEPITVTADCVATSVFSLSTACLVT